MVGRATAEDGGSISKRSFNSHVPFPQAGPESYREDVTGTSLWKNQSA